MRKNWSLTFFELKFKQIFESCFNYDKKFIPNLNEIDQIKRIKKMIKLGYNINSIGIKIDKSMLKLIKEFDTLDEKDQKKVKIVYTVDENVWNNKTTLQLVLKDVKEL